jgi:hypothetical protein
MRRGYRGCTDDRPIYYGIRPVRVGPGYPICSDILGLIREEDRKLADGEVPLEVLAWVLDDETAGWALWGDGTSPDPPDDDRL